MILVNWVALLTCAIHILLSQTLALAMSATPSLALHNA